MSRGTRYVLREGADVLARGGVRGFRWSGIPAGIKKNGTLDLGLIAAERPVAAAAVFTTNLVKAAPVLLAARRVRDGKASAVLANSGCANACTGALGMKNAERSCAAVARVLAIDPRMILPASTGVIGAQLAVEHVEQAAPALVDALTESTEGIDAFSRAIMTTDRGPKIARADLEPSDAVAIVGVAKGAGMIHPDLATTLAFVVTDASVPAGRLRAALARAAGDSFGRISVDGDTSTNDTIVVLASGRAGPVASEPFVEALTQVLGALGRMIVADGEGAEHAVRVRIAGAKTDAAARTIARTIATSPLVKTALHGRDPNWGRILAAIGRAGVPLDPGRVEIAIEDVTIVRKGLAVGEEAETAARAIMARPEYDVRVKVGSGRGAAEYLMCDLGHEYIRINADYRS